MVYDFGKREARANPRDLSLTWKFSHGLRNDILIPLNLFSAEEPSELEHELGGYDCAERFCAILTAQRFKYSRIVELNFLYSVLHGIVNMQEKLERLASWRGADLCKVSPL